MITDCKFCDHDHTGPNGTCPGCPCLAGQPGVENLFILTQHPEEVTLIDNYSHTVTTWDAEKKCWTGKHWDSGMEAIIRGG